MTMLTDELGTGVHIIAYDIAAPAAINDPMAILEVSPGTCAKLLHYQGVPYLTSSSIKLWIVVEIVAIPLD